MMDSSPPIRRLEYKNIEISDLPGPHQITPQTAKDIINLAAWFGCSREGEWFTYRGNNAQVLRCGGWVGTIQSGNRQIEVCPKIENIDESETEVDLINLLIGAGVIEAEFREVASLADRATIFELLALWYARRIARECNRGLSRGYMEVSDDIPGKRGSIDFSKQWQNVARRRHLISCRFDEHTEDNQLNRILKAGLRAALSSCINLPECRIALSNTLKLLDGISDVVVLADSAIAFKPERKDVRFKPLVKLAARFIKNKEHQNIRAGSEATPPSEGLSSMWSAWQLFESYVYRSLSGEDPGSKLKLATKWKIKKQVAGRYMTHKKGPNGPNDFGYLLKPDIIIYDDAQRPVLICDTKWKYYKRDGDEDASYIKGRGRFVVKKSDLYQMFAYSRFYAKDGLYPEIALIYPTQTQTIQKCVDSAPLSMLNKVDTLYFNLSDSTESTAVHIYEFPVPVSGKLSTPLVSK